MARRRPASLRLCAFGTIALVAAGTAAALAGPKVQGTASSHEVSWESSIGFNYQVEVSSDLELWEDTSIVEPGTGMLLSYVLSNPAKELFYRIRETTGVFDDSFLVLPIQDQQVALVEGVCFSFNLAVLPSLPAKIRIYQRPAEMEAEWVKIGELTEFAELDGLRTLRGSAVWIPGTEGFFDVRAAVVDEAGVVIGTATRTVSVGPNESPSIEITGGPASPSPMLEPAVFTTVATDPDDQVRRVEFFDNGTLIGIDRVEPFGDQLEDVEGNMIFPILLRGVHQITARVYDARGASSETAASFDVEITGGNARPAVQILSPQDGLVVESGESFSIDVDVTDADGLDDVDNVTANDLTTFAGDFDFIAPFGPLMIDTTGWQPGSHTIRVLVTDNNFDVSYPAYLQVYVRSAPEAEFAGTLVASIVDEATAVPSGESFFGVEASSGEFVDGQKAGLEMDKGILLTSGLFHLWDGDDIGEGIDETDDPTFMNAKEIGDPILEDRVAGRETNDAAILTFDVFCVHSQLELEFQFGSEEFVDYVSDGAEEGCFNDAFMVTVDDVVVSLLPDCSDIVAVNNVHPAITVAESLGCLSVDLPAVNEHLYLDDEDDIDPLVAPEDSQVEYDGMTVRLRLHAFVTPNETHRVRIVIADVNDDQLDSGVFVKEGSVRTVAP